jgi:hypothetical protein
MKGTLIASSLFISLAILLFNGTFGYFILTSHYGVQNGVYFFIGLSCVAIVASLTPILMKLLAYRFYFRVLLYTNVIVAFYPLIYKLIAEYIIAKLL